MSSSLCQVVRRLTPILSQCRPALVGCTPPSSRDLLLYRPAESGTCRHLHLSSYQASSGGVAAEVQSNEELVPERLYSRVVIKVKGADFRVLESYCRFVITAAKALDINISGRVALPTRIQKFTVLKSIHIFKKHRVQYEVRTHMRLMQVKEITGTTADIFLEYIQRNLPEGVSMTVNQEKMDTLPALLTSPPEGEAAAAPPNNTKEKK